MSFFARARARRSTGTPRRGLHPLLTPRVGLLVVGAAVALTALRGSTSRVPGPVSLHARNAVAVPLPVYTIEATSGTHHATIANLPITPLGVADVPIPINVSGGVLPDLLVSVDLVNVRGLFPNQPGSGEILAPTLRIARVLAGAPLEPVKLPLRIDAVITLVDTSGGSTKIRLGYDTGAGGSAPPAFSIVAGGLTQLFNPLQAQVIATSYQGPLSVIAGAQTSTSRVDADVRFAPFPTGLTFTYGSDTSGQHFQLQHAGPVGNPNGDVDLTATVTTTGSSPSSIVAHLDRLPHSMSLTLQPGAGDGTGGFDYTAAPAASGRLPDLSAHYTGTGPGNVPLVADINVVGLPTEVDGAWSLAPNKPASVHLAAPQQPVGAIDATVAIDPGKDHLVRRLPGQPQYLSLQEGATDERLITGHIDSLQLVDFAQNANGFTGHFQAAGAAQPLEVHAGLASVSDQKWDVDATSTVTPLPNDVTVALATAGADQLTDPLTLTYTASSSVSVAGQAQLRPAGSGAACGANGTICADLSVADIPQQIQARLSRVSPATGVQGETRLAVDTQPRPGSPNPTIVADATVGTSTVPIVAHAEADDLPQHLRIRTVDGAAGSTALAQFNSCDENYVTNTCAAGTQAPVGALKFGIRDFLTRPDDLPPAVVTPNSNSLAVTGRGEPNGTVEFDAEGQVNDVSEFDYVNDNVFGIRTQVGGGQALDAAVNLVGIPGPGGNPLDLKASTTISGVPTTFEFCLQQAGEPLRAQPISQATANCEETQPFGPSVPLTSSPLSVSYVADAPIAKISTDATIVEHGAVPVDDQRITAHLGIKNLPAEATLHILTPSDGTVRAVYKAQPLPGPTPPPTDITFSASVADADLVCEDPRVPANGQSVSCVSGEIKGLPTLATVTFLPDQEKNNFAVHTDNPIGLPSLHVSSVKGALDHGVLKSDAKVADVSIPTLPADLTGTIHTSPVAAIQLQATPPISLIDATLQTFAGASPLPTTAPAPRTDVPTLVDPDTIVMYQRGGLLRATAHLTNLSSGGYQEGTNGVKVVDVGFGQGKSVRAYIDLDDGTSSVIGDVDLAQVPSTLRVCFRGAPSASPDAPQLGTFCESSSADKGAFEMDAGPHPSTQRMDVFAYLRSEADNGTGLISGWADILDLPDIVRGEIGSNGLVDIKGLQAGTLDPEGIGRIEAHYATFDLTDTGYPVPPVSAEPMEQDPFPVKKQPNTQQIGIAADASNLEAYVELGPPNPGDPGSEVQHIRAAPNACAAPAGITDYPQYPAPDSKSADPNPYTCVRADFQETSTQPDPLAISMAIDKSSRLVMKDAVLDDVPQWLQASLSTLDGLNPSDPSQPFLPRCPTGNAPAATTPCVPPMLRYDSADVNGDLSGTLEIGSAANLTDLDHIGDPAVDLPDLAAEPTAAGWSSWSTAGSDPQGVRAALDTLKDGSLIGRIGFRLPVPDELTVDPVQTFSNDFKGQTQAGDENFGASNIALHYAAKKHGVDIPSLGRLAAVQKSADGSLLVATDGQERQITAPTGATYQTTPNGIPGELDLAVYLRDNKLDGRLYAQIDGTVNQETNLRLRLIPPTSDNAPPSPSGNATKPVIDLEAINLPTPDPSQPAGTPAFRIQTEVDGGAEPLNPPLPSPNNCPGWFDSGTCTPSTTIGIDTIGAVLDFHLPGSVPVRLLKAEARYDIGQGFQIQAFKDVSGDTAPSALLSGEAFIKIDPLDISWVDQIYLADVNVQFTSKLDLTIELDHVSDVAMRAADNHIKVDNVTSNLGEGSVYVLPDVNLESFHSAGGIDLGPIHFDVLGVDFFDFPDAPVQNKFDTCFGVGGPTTTTLDGGTLPAIPVESAVEQLLTPGVFQSPLFTYHPVGLVVKPSASADVVALPDESVDGRWLPTVSDIPIPFPFGGDVLANIFDSMTCGISLPDMQLIGASPEIHPANALDALAPPVPGALVDTSTLGPPQPIVGQDLTVPAGQQQLICGTNIYNDVEVYGELDVASGTGTDPGDCAATTQEGELQLDATTVHVHTGGEILGAVAAEDPPPQGGATPCCFIHVVADNITIDNGGTIKAQTGPISLDSREDVTLAPGSVVNADGSRWSLFDVSSTNEGCLPDAWSGGGGGHGGDGGDTTQFDNGACNDPHNSIAGTHFGDTSPGSILSEGGQSGDIGGDEPQTSDILGGHGGGMIRITGNTIDVSGTVSANGLPGPDHCLEGVTQGDGGGGGAGGGIVLAASVLHVDPTATVTANGGDGGDGTSIKDQSGNQDGQGGGGGGGGIIKILAPLYTGPAIGTPQAGDGGNDQADPRNCTLAPVDNNGTPSAGDPGKPGVVITNNNGQSLALPFAQIWNTELPNGGTTRDLKLSVRAAIPDTSLPYQVAVCGLYLPPSYATDHIGGDLSKPEQGIPQASDFKPQFDAAYAGVNVTPANPCGNLHPVATHTFTGPVGPGGTTSNLIDMDLSKFCAGKDPACPDGFWALWTMVVAPTPAHPVQDVPGEPNIVVGVDDDPPLVTETGVTSSTEAQDSPGSWFTSKPAISFTIKADDHTRVDSAGHTTDIGPVSGIASISCEETDPLDSRVHNVFNCGSGPNTYTLTSPGDGRRFITVSVTDNAGNTATTAVDPTVSDPVFPITTDITPPQRASIIHVPSPDGRNGFYLTPPVIDIGNPEDANNSDGSPGSGEAQPPTPKFEYRFDDAAPEQCPVTSAEDPTGTGDVCRVLDFPPQGTHRISMAAIDQVGNILPLDQWPSDTFSVDSLPPTSVLSTVPTQPDGTGGWFVTDPEIVLSGFDGLDGSGLVNPPGGDGTAGFYYQVMPEASPPSEIHYTGPFQLGPGTHTVCWRGQSVAGTTDVVGTGPGGVPTQHDYDLRGHCFSYSVDTSDPMVTATVTPSQPDGQGGWYTVPPTIQLTASDPAPGSGLATPGLFVATDGGAFAPYAGTITLGQGQHRVDWYAIDQAGRQSSIVERDFDVDLTPPTVTAHVLPPLPALAPWWRRPVTVTLSATDGDGGPDESGVATVAYSLDGAAFQPYTGPIVVGSGPHTITTRALDVAGLISPPHTVPLLVDDTPPTALAGSPSPAIWAVGSPATATLPFKVGDDQSSHVAVSVVIMDGRGEILRTLPAGTINVTPGGPPTAGSVTWDGKDSSGKTLALGLVTYRVVATDQAGNIAESAESNPIQLLLPAINLPAFLIHVLIDIG